MFYAGYHLQKTFLNCSCSMENKHVPEVRHTERRLHCITAPPGHTPNARHDDTIGACPGCPKPVAIGMYCSIHPKYCVFVHSLDISMRFHIDISGEILLAVAKHHATLEKHSVFLLHSGTSFPHGSRFEHHISALVRSKARAVTNCGLHTEHSALLIVKSHHKSTVLFHRYPSNSRVCRNKYSCRSSQNIYGLVFAMEKSIDEHEPESSPERPAGHSWTAKEEHAARRK